VTIKQVCTALYVHKQQQGINSKPVAHVQPARKICTATVQLEDGLDESEVLGFDG